MADQSEARVKPVVTWSGQLTHDEESWAISLQGLTLRRSQGWIKLGEHVAGVHAELIAWLACVYTLSPPKLESLTGWAVTIEEKLDPSSSQLFLHFQKNLDQGPINKWWWCWTGVERIDMKIRWMLWKSEIIALISSADYG